MTNKQLKDKMLEFIKTQRNDPLSWDESYSTPAMDACYVLKYFAEFIGLDSNGLEIEGE